MEEGGKRLTKAGEGKQEVKTSEKGGEAEDGWQGKESCMGEKDNNFYMYVLKNLWHVVVWCVVYMYKEAGLRNAELRMVHWTLKNAS